MIHLKIHEQHRNSAVKLSNCYRPVTRQVWQYYVVRTNYINCLKNISIDTVRLIYVGSDSR